MTAPWKSWTVRDYIMAALSGCLAATAIIIIVSVILSPGRIIFSVTHATRSTANDGGVNLKLVISANNTSHRAKVKYLSFFVTVTNSTSSKGRFTADAHVENKFPTDNYLSDGSMEITASIHMAHDMASSFAGRRLDSDAGFTVVLTSQVRFQIGVAPTKIFDVKLSCPRIAFVEELTMSPAQPCDG